MFPSSAYIHFCKFNLVLCLVSGSRYAGLTEKSKYTCTVVVNLIGTFFTALLLLEADIHTANKPKGKAQSMSISEANMIEMHFCCIKSGYRSYYKRST